MEAARKLQLKENYDYLTKDVAYEKLIAVSKYHPFSDVLALHEVGHSHFGESRVQDLKNKALQAVEHNVADIKWHFIGHLQSNKVKDLFKIHNLFAIHSVDSTKLLDEMKKREHLLGSDVSIFLQINTSGEEEKSGLSSKQDILEIVEYFIALGFVKIKLLGLMTIGKVRTDCFEQDAKKSFLQLASYKQSLDQTYALDLKLSMGMSADFKWALEHGADFVRVGSAIFKT